MMPKCLVVWLVIALCCGAIIAVSATIIVFGGIPRLGGAERSRQSYQDRQPREMPSMPSSNPEPYSYGKPFDIADLSKKAAKVKPLSKRDASLLKALREAAAAAESQVVPFYLGPNDKMPTVKLAAKRLAERNDLAVNVGSHRSYEGAILLSRGNLRGRRTG